MCDDQCKHWQDGEDWLQYLSKLDRMKNMGKKVLIERPRHSGKAWDLELHKSQTERNLDQKTFEKEYLCDWTIPKIDLGEPIEPFKSDLRFDK